MRHAGIICQYSVQSTHISPDRQDSEMQTDGCGPSDNISSSYPQWGATNCRRGQHHVWKPYAPSTDGGLAVQESREEGNGPGWSWKRVTRC